jgi:hypothetical protein
MDFDIGDEQDENSMLGALRSIGETTPGATYNPITTGVHGALGEDNLDVRVRAKAALGERDVCYSQLKDRHQVNLNDGGNLADLEDPALMEHMDNARAQFMSYQAKLGEIPTAANMGSADLHAKLALSGLTTRLNDQKMVLHTACGEVHLQAANAGKLAGGGRPHGYPTMQTPLTPDQAQVFAWMQLKLDAASAELSRIGDTIETFECEVILARRAYEAVAVGLTRRSSYFEGLTAFGRQLR